MELVDSSTCWLTATVLGMVTAESLTTSRTLVASVGDTPTALTVGFIDVLVDGLVYRLVNVLVDG